MDTRLPTLIIGLSLLAAAAFAQPADDRIGLAETFDTLDSWRKIDFPREEAPLKEMKIVDGVAVFVTHPAPLRSRRKSTKWHDGLTPHDSASNIAKDYAGIDLDRYRYLVMKIDEKGTPFSVIINHVDLPVAYTTGVRAVDLSLYRYKDTELKGKQPIEFRIQFGNTGGTVKVDWFRFVSELTDEEKKGLIPPGIVVPKEDLREDLTQGLDAVLARVDRPRRDDAPPQQLCFRDTATGAVIWRLSGNQRGSSVVSDSVRTIFNASGSHMMIPSFRGGAHLYDFRTGRFTPRPFGGISRFSPRDPEVLWCIEKMRGNAGIRFHRINIATGADEVVGEATFDTKKYHSSVTDIGFADAADVIAVGLRETPYVFLLDASKAKHDERVRVIELPMRLKGMGLSPDGKRLFWNRCYWYEPWEMDLQTRKIRRCVRLGGSHAGGGGGLTLGHYQGLIVAEPVGLNDPVAGDKIKILLNYREGWHTDYGHLSHDALWYIANGAGGDMKNRLIMAAVPDPGTVLQVAQQNTSRNGWGNNTVIRSSTDCTKLTWVSDIWGCNAVCIAYTMRPLPPQGLTVERDGDAALLRWKRQSKLFTWRAPQETMGFNVYRSVNNGPFLPLNAEAIRAESWRDEDVDDGSLYQYIVCAQEHSGLEGCPSNAATLCPTEIGKLPFIRKDLHFEAEHAMLGVPARQVFNGWCGGWRCVRVTPVVEGEKTGRVEFRFQPEYAGEYTLWLRVRAEKDAGAWDVSLGRDALGKVGVNRKDWEWAKLAVPVALQKKQCRLVLTSHDERLCVDRIILTNRKDYTPKAVDDRFATPPKKVEYVIAKEVTDSSVHLAWWDPKAAPDVDYYSVYVGMEPDFPVDQAHLVGSTRTGEFLDWGLKPGAEYTYRIVAFNRQALASEPASITLKTKPLARRVLLELSAAKDAKLDERLKTETKGGKTCAWLPDQGKGHEKDPHADVTWEFDLPVKDKYLIWCEYAPADHSRSSMKVPVLLDDFLGGKATWTMRTPYRSMSGPNYRLWKEDLWFVDKVHMYVWPRPRDLFRLSAGKHKLTIRLSPAMKEFHHKIARVWITNDPSFRPPGWDPQANFTKSRITRK